MIINENMYKTVVYYLTVVAVVIFCSLVTNTIRVKIKCRLQTKIKALVILIYLLMCFTTGQLVP